MAYTDTKIVEIITSEIASYGCDLDLSAGETDNFAVITAIATAKLQTSIGLYETLNVVLRDRIVELLAPHGIVADDLLHPVSVPVTSDLSSPAISWARGMIAGVVQAQGNAKIHAAAYSLILAHAHWGRSTAKSAALAYFGGFIPARLACE